MSSRPSGSSQGYAGSPHARRPLSVVTGGATAAMLAGILLLAGEPVAAQCAMCRTALASPEGQQMIAALRSGILLLLAAPFTLFGLIAILAVRSQRRRQSGLERHPQS